ncbi:MAG: Bax inhibitor-1/YccA family protein [Flavobacteriaceae bacterium]|nr:Bax inhibitor-1/YccA family protein [Flavobacteriaceae bacterium]MCY4268160.1 Bax inhibitor-1/YccA family protein [Flavobacteriaceae bacterium]MCY4298155.1 Bax inhibitor-1/YccA family protein [Flavobacteriaceae bacterium]
MSAIITQKSGNPVFGSRAFDRSKSVHATNTMTLNGTLNKIFLSIGLMVAIGFLTYQSMTPGWIIGTAIAGFVVAIVTVFKKQWAPTTVPIYAILEGAFLGGISAVYGTMYQGIVFQAIFITLAILVTMLMLYRSGAIRVTNKFRLGVIAATGGVFLFYFASFILGFFGINVSVLDPTNASLMAIGINLVIIVIAALNLVLDFDFIDKASKQSLPKYMEWYGAFGLLVTLIWLYLEILRLLARLNSRQ